MIASEDLYSEDDELIIDFDPKDDESVKQWLKRNESKLKNIINDFKGAAEYLMTERYSEEERREDLKIFFEEYDKLLTIYSSNDTIIYSTRLFKELLNLSYGDITEKYFYQISRETGIDADEADKILSKYFSYEEKDMILNKSFYGSYKNEEIAEYFSKVFLLQVFPSYVYEKLVKDYNARSSRKYIKTLRNIFDYYKPQTSDLDDILERMKRYKESEAERRRILYEGIDKKEGISIGSVLSTVAKIAAVYGIYRYHENIIDIGTGLINYIWTHLDDIAVYAFVGYILIIALFSDKS